MKPKLLIVDDDEEIRAQMKWALVQDYDVALADDRPKALECFKDQRPQVVLLDLGLPPQPGTPEEGLAALAEMLVLDKTAKIIIVSGQGEKTNALEAIGAGAYDFLTKPVQLEELKVILRRTFHVAGLEREYRELQLRLQADTFEGLLGTSPQMQRVFTSIRKVATTEAPVLVLGESGTGKEMVALAIHRRSARKDGPFVAINCGAIPETLLESELFGHEKGSFTGAHAQRKGRIESAGGGTLFLDEIGEIPLQLQVKLLRFLQEQSIERVGGRQTIQVDTRVIAATNVDLKKAVAEEKFREDLYYRLAVVVVSLPPLREREGDLLLLAQEFLRRNAAASGKEGLGFGQAAVRAINAHAWPGNVRELENRVKRAVIMAESKRIAPEDLELENPVSPAASLNLKEAREAVERDIVNRALRKHNGKITPAAAELGISRPTFYELMEKLGIGRAEHEGKTTEADEKRGA
ncbi:MAG TPA: PEP-CTERM-box response regulator transcription factor [Verrucomicrobiae bacterium]|nr:PEP-CTERM-box response regulator transcription factor [Verrucomicrobiae bacterium]